MDLIYIKEIKKASIEKCTIDEEINESIRATVVLTIETDSVKDVTNNLGKEVTLVYTEKINYLLFFFSYQKSIQIKTNREQQRITIVLELRDKLFLLQVSNGYRTYSKVTASNALRDILNENNISVSNQVKNENESKIFYQYGESDWVFFQNLSKTFGLFFLSLPKKIILSNNNSVFTEIGDIKKSSIKEENCTYEVKRASLKKTHCYGFQPLDPILKIEQETKDTKGAGNRSLYFSHGKDGAALTQFSHFMSEVLGGFFFYTGENDIFIGNIIKEHELTYLIKKITRSFQGGVGFLNRVETCEFEKSNFKLEYFFNSKFLQKQTNIVTGIVDENLTIDSTGSIPISFPWDKKKQKHIGRLSTLMSYNNIGTYFCPRSGEEIIVLLEENDIFILGSLRNKTNLLSYDTPWVSSIKTESEDKQSSHEILLDHRSGTEQILVQSNKIITMTADENINFNSGKNLQITTEESTQLDSKTMVCNIKEDFNLKTEKELNINIGTDTKIENKKNIHIQSGDQITFKGNDISFSTQDYKISGTSGEFDFTNIKLSAKASITISVGASSISITPAGITIKSTAISLVATSVSITGSSTTITAASGVFTGMLNVMGAITVMGHPVMIL